MEDNFNKVKAKGNELGLSASQIKAALKLFQYAKIYKVELYLKENDGLGMRKDLSGFKNPSDNIENATRDFIKNFGGL
jgi:hypothetical protein